MKSIQPLNLYAISAFLFCSIFMACYPSPEIFQRRIYTWVETKVYNQENDSTITIRRTGYDDTYRFVFEYDYAALDLMTFYKGDQVLLSSGLRDFYQATGDETDCYGEGWCYELDCGYEICTRNWGDLDGEYTVIIYQFPFLDGNFHNGCNSSSLFKVGYENY